MVGGVNRYFGDSPQATWNLTRVLDRFCTFNIDDHHLRKWFRFLYIVIY